MLFFPLTYALEKLRKTEKQREGKMRPFVHPPASSHRLRSFYLCPNHRLHPPPQLLLFSYSVVSDSLQPHGLQHTSLPCLSVSLSLLKLTSLESVMPSNHLILCCPLLPPFVFPSIRVFSNVSALRVRWPKYWSFSFSISPSMNIQGWLPLGLTGWISSQSKGPSRVFSHHSLKASIV